ncbi:DUF5687 family protein [Mariniflexile ostreae]|uniref:DUF5687 family protein n=1 Tax=Mariniflexile ostreae TaxID=1520892 RepID=A0ABV5F750_9FLAO
MIKHFLSLEWKSFFRSASFKVNVVLKMALAFSSLFMVASFLSLGIGAYYLIEEHFNQDPLRIVNQMLVFYVVFDLVFRYFFQKMPIINIKPLLYLPIKKNKIVSFGLIKTMPSFYNVIHTFFFLPFSFVLVKEGYPISQVLGWYLALTAMLFSNNFINVFISNKDLLLYILLVIFLGFGVLKYYDVLDISSFTAPLFQIFYDRPFLAVVPSLWLIFFYVMAFHYYRRNLYLDSGLAKKVDVAHTQDLAWLNRFGSLSVFLKNDIKLIKRNKRSRSTLFMSVLFLFYGLMFFTGGVEAYSGPFWRVFAGIFVSGGFLFSFGQFVPSWDSAYYPLMMSQNIRYKAYLNSKWYLMVAATGVSTLLASFYLYFGWQAYLAIIAGAIYNVGINGYMVLWGGAYVKTPIDLASGKKAFGDKKSFNAKTVLLTIPKVLLPMLVYAIGHFTLGDTFGLVLVMLLGVLGLLFKNKVFKAIEKVYKKEKYKTLAAYKQTN